MNAVGYIGVFLALSGVVLFRHADDKKQHDIASAFVGIGIGMLVIFFILKGFS